MCEQVRIPRLFLVALTTVAWFVATAHCSFAAAVNATFSQVTNNEDMPEGCPMHAKAKKSAPHSPKKDGCGDLPCCKNLPAAAATGMKFFCKPVCVPAPVNAFLFSLDSLDLTRSKKPLFILDTGPPVAQSFTESVLQRSILAHAPPAALS
jgi:hypothetical protein